MTHTILIVSVQYVRTWVFSQFANLWRKVKYSYSGPRVIHGYCWRRHLLCRDYGTIIHQLVINSPVSP